MAIPAGARLDPDRQSGTVVDAQGRKARDREIDGIGGIVIGLGRESDADRGQRSHADRGLGSAEIEVIGLGQDRGIGEPIGILDLGKRCRVLISSRNLNALSVGNSAKDWCLVVHKTGYPREKKSKGPWI